jgi:hypothetical protein
VPHLGNSVKPVRRSVQLTCDSVEIDNLSVATSWGRATQRARPWARVERGGSCPDDTQRGHSVLPRRYSVKVITDSVKIISGSVAAIISSEGIRDAKIRALAGSQGGRVAREDDIGKFTLLARVGRVFSPGAPVDKYALFAGRRQQVADVFNAVNQRSQHVVLYGERGVGKTSLANVLGEIFADSSVGGLNSGTVNCDRKDSFSTLWHKAFREITVNNGDADVATLNDWLNKDVSPEDVRYLLGFIPNETIVILDEVDLIQDNETKELLADTIKTLADHSSPTTLVLVGVADSVDELIAYHESLERSLVQVRMPRMSHDELLEIVDNGAEVLGMSVDDDARRTIADRSEGLPHFTHLLSLYSFQRAVVDDRTNVSSLDVIEATKMAVSKAQQSILSDYHKATFSQQKDTLYGKVLLACALAPTDALGFFAARDIREPLSRIAGKRYEIPAFSRHLNELSAPARGPVLQQTGEQRRYRFRFVNPMMQPFVIMLGLAGGLITDADLTKAT